MKVVLSGYYGFDNVGDEAILYSIIQVLREIEPAIEITVLSNAPEKTASTYQVKAVNRWSIPEIFKALKASDGLISGGGSLLQDETGMKSIPYYTGVMKLAHFAGKPVFVYAQGMGPIHKKVSKWITKNALNKTKITVRDQDSLTLLQNIGIKKPINIVPDPVLGLKRKEQKSAWWENQSFAGPVITVSVRDWPSTVNFKGKIAKSLDSLAKEGNTIVFVPMHGAHDEKASKEVAEMMIEKSYIAPHDATIEEKITIIGESDLLVGMRLHALIFSAITYTPFIALSYDPKIDAFANIADQQVAGHVLKDNWDESTLVSAIKETLENKETKIKNLCQKIEPQQKHAVHTAEEALRYFKQL